MDVEEAIRGLRVVRRFSERLLPDGLLERIVDAGRLAGSSKNLQRWSFITITERATLERLSQAGPFAGHVAGAAAAIALVTPDPSTGQPLSVMWDLGRAAQNMVLLALANGVGSCPATVYEQPLTREILGHPPEHHCEYLLSFGYPEYSDELDRPPRDGGRLTLDEVRRREHW